MLSFLLGIALSLNLPVGTGSVLLPILSMLGIILFSRRTRARWVGWLGVGVIWGAAALALMHQMRPPPQLAPADVVVTGEVRGLVERDDGVARFRLRPEKIDPYPAHRPLPRILDLRWYGLDGRVEPGQRWRLAVRLERPRGLLNPGAFDYERYLAGRRIDAVGYVRDEGPAELIGAQVTADSLRSRLASRLSEHTPDTAGAAVLRAIALGDRRGLDDELWETFRRTGTAHLVAISGLHIGLAAGLGWFIGTRLSAASPWLSARWPARAVGGTIALGTAAAYAQLAGWSMPTVRALTMLALGVVALFARRRWSPMRVTTAAMLVMAVVDPWGLLSSGFWLSFGAVFLLLAGIAMAPSHTGKLGLMVRLQALLACGMAVLTLFFFGQAAWAAFPANLIAIPVFSLVLVPATLLTAALVGLAPGTVAARECAELVAVALDYSIALLNWTSGVAGSVTPDAAVASAAALVFGMAGLLLRGLVPLPVPWLGAALLVVPMALMPDERLRLTVLEVGQGTAAVVETPGYTLVYDTGPKWGDTAAARFSLWPYLKARDLLPVDELVLSHRDQDHAGGLALLRRRDAYQRLRIGGPDTGDAIPCRAGDNWQRDGAVFRVVWPPTDRAREGNAGSCVVLIEAGGERMLLSGDIGREQEAAVVDRLTGPVDAVLVPHHGSSDASSPRFVDRLDPSLAIVSAGYANAYGLPDQGVVTRYRCQGSRILTTGIHGAVAVVVDSDGRLQHHSERRDARRFYHEGLRRPAFQGPQLIEYDPTRHGIPACREGTR